MADYDFRLSPEYAGKSATVTDADGSEVAGSPITLDSEGAGSLDLSTENAPYTASVAHAGSLPSASAEGTLDIPESLDQPGASQTAYFIATHAGDTSDSLEQVTLEADPAHGDLPSWVTIVDGAAVLGADAGGVIAAMEAQTDIDYTATSKPNDPGASVAHYNIEKNGSGFATGASLANGVTLTGTGAATVSLDPVTPDGGLVFGGTITALAAASATDAASAPITDGVATHHINVNITRVSPLS